MSKTDWPIDRGALAIIKIALLGVFSPAYRLRQQIAVDRAALAPVSFADAAKPTARWRNSLVGDHGARPGSTE
jgi:hypothetical protein